MLEELVFGLENANAEGAGKSSFENSSAMVPGVLGPGAPAGKPLDGVLGSPEDMLMVDVMVFGWYDLNTVDPIVSQPIHATY
jgi:hypothetical protein